MRTRTWRAGAAVLAAGLLAGGAALGQASSGPSDFDPRGVPEGSMSTDDGLVRFHGVGSDNTNTGDGRLSPVQPGVEGLDPYPPLASPPPGINPSGTGQPGVPDRTPDNFFPLGRPPGR